MWGAGPPLLVSSFKDAPKGRVFYRGGWSGGTTAPPDRNGAGLVPCGFHFFDGQLLRIGKGFFGTLIAGQGV